MTPGARISAAIAVLDQVFDGKAAEQALTGWARGARYAGSKDRAAVRDHVYQALRCRRSYAAFGGGETGRAVMIGALRCQGADLALLFSGEGHAPAPLSMEEQAAGAAPRSGADSHDLPDWLWDRFKTSLADQAGSAALALKQRAPVALRVNIRAKSVKQAIEKLKEDSVVVVPSPSAETALIVTEGARRVATAKAYRNGWVELQDTSSQAAMAMLSLPPGGRMLDYCAGGGGKVLALAARQQGAWFAHDVAPQRMRDLPDRAARAGVNVTRVATEGLDKSGVYDLVLCDVPCSGSGTWRRTPDAKWRLTSERLDDLRQIQAGILDAATRLVAPGGMLAYSTCSVLCEENEDQIAAFLARSPGWQVVHQHRWPISAHGDGFYLARLSRR